MHPIFDDILTRHFPATKAELTEANKEVLRRELEDEDKKLPTWLRGHLLEQVKE